MGKAFGCGSEMRDWGEGLGLGEGGEPLRLHWVTGRVKCDSVWGQGDLKFCYFTGNEALKKLTNGISFCQFALGLS